MLKKLKCIALLLVIAVMLQSILMPAISTAEAENIVMEVAVPQLSLKNFSNTSNSVKLVWTFSDNSIETAWYDIYRNNSLVKTSTSVTYTDTELTPKTEYTYSVKAKNNGGKVIAESNTLAVTTLVESAKTRTTSDIVESNISIPNIAEPVNITSSAIILEQIETKKELDKMEESKLFSKGNPDFETDRFIIKYKNENSKIKARKAFEKIDRIDKNKKNDLKNNKKKNIDIISLNRKQKLKDFAADLLKNDLGNDIEYIQPDYQLKLSSNDPYYSSQWGLENNSNNASITENVTHTTTSQSALFFDAGVTEAWNVSTGSGITVAVIDTGIDIAHEDLAENIWVNIGEITNNGIDDDGNGKIDDLNGWNFSDDNNIVCDTYNMGNENHGTHVAGIIAAVKDNGKGIAGVAPSAKVMPLKVFKNGMAYTSDIINAIQYAENMGVRIVNCSWGSNVVDNTALKEAIQNSSMLFVCAAGNTTSNIDINPVYPAAFDCSNIITVASVNKYGRLSSFSNYGKNSVDVAAPGEGIQSTLAGNIYDKNSGTSMATAFVSGEAALLLSIESAKTINDIKSIITNSSDKYSNLTNKIYSGNMNNCYNAAKGKIGNRVINMGEYESTATKVSKSGDEFNLFGDISSGMYKIISKNSGKCIEVEDSSTANCAKILQNDYTGNSNQRWEVKSTADGYYEILALHSGKCMDVEGVSIINGARIQQYEYLGGNNQQWKIEYVGDGYYKIISKNSGKSLDVEGVSVENEAEIQQYDYLGGNNQLWKLELVSSNVISGMYKIISKNSGKCIEVEDSSTANCAKTLQNDYTGNSNQRWEVKSTADGYYEILALHSGKCMDVEGVSIINGARIQQYEYLGGNNQQWKIEYVGDGYYKIISKNSGKSLDVEGVSVENEAEIQQYDYLGGNNQLWKLELVSSNVISGTYKIISKNSGKCIEVEGSSKANCAKMQQNDYTGNSNQRWEVKSIGDGYYEILALHSGKCMDVEGVSIINGARIQQYEYVGGNNQQWKIEYVGDGCYKIISKNSGKSLDVEGVSVENEAEIQQYEYLGGNNQLWIIAEVSCTSYQYDENNQLVYIYRNGRPFIYFKYDNNGNLTSKEIITQ